DFPVCVYQIQDKFRNEPRAKSGLLRGREFSMKDMYSFHSNEEDLDRYYNQVIKAYFNIYNRCGLGSITHLVFSSGGTFSRYSHEFQTLAEDGEDTIYLCQACGVGVNKEIISEQQSCPECGGKDLKEKKSIEVGNIFKLKTKYSEAFDYEFTDEDGNRRTVLMGCYGIGPSRVMGSMVEVYHDKNGIIWPESVAPFAAHLVSLCKNGAQIKQADDIYESLLRKKIDVLYDDRLEISAGQKFADSDLFGIPKRIIVSPKTLERRSVEIKNRGEEKTILLKINNL
ncbi:MAG: aminoacyl--tRNA ligase-related protein, partial [Patescibacteria group bacterium]